MNYLFYHENIFNTPLTRDCNPALLDFLRGMDSHCRSKDRMLKVYTHCHDKMFQRDNNNPQHRMKGLFLLLHTVYSYLIHRLCTPFLHHTQLLQVASNIGNMYNWILTTYKWILTTKVFFPPISRYSSFISAGSNIGFHSLTGKLTRQFTVGVLLTVRPFTGFIIGKRVQNVVTRL